MVEDCVYPLKMKSYTCQKTVEKKKTLLIMNAIVLLWLTLQTLKKML